MNLVTISVLVRIEGSYTQLEWQLDISEYQKYFCNPVEVVFNKLAHLKKYKLVSITMYWEHGLSK